MDFSCKFAPAVHIRSTIYHPPSKDPGPTKVGKLALVPGLQLIFFHYPQANKASLGTGRPLTIASPRENQIKLLFYFRINQDKVMVMVLGVGPENKLTLYGTPSTRGESSILTRVFFPVPGGRMPLSQTK